MASSPRGPGSIGPGLAGTDPGRNSRALLNRLSNAPELLAGTSTQALTFFPPLLTSSYGLSFRRLVFLERYSDSISCRKSAGERSTHVKEHDPICASPFRHNRRPCAATAGSDAGTAGKPRGERGMNPRPLGTTTVLTISAYVHMLTTLGPSSGPPAPCRIDRGPGFRSPLLFFQLSYRRTPSRPPWHRGFKSRRRGSEPRHSAWKADALPLSLHPAARLPLQRLRDERFEPPTPLPKQVRFRPRHVPLIRTAMASAAR